LFLQLIGELATFKHDPSYVTGNQLRHRTEIEFALKKRDLPIPNRQQRSIQAKEVTTHPNSCARNF
jgi:hypothetical protein